MKSEKDLISAENQIHVPIETQRLDPTQGNYETTLHSLAISATLILPVIVATQGVAQIQRPRKIEIRISKKVPVKLTIKDEAISAFRMSDNREWSRAFKVEITNTGTKPILRLCVRNI